MLDRVERPDDRARSRAWRACFGRLGDDGRAAGEPYLEAARRAARVRPRADVERRTRARCCAAIATATPRSTATPRTTPYLIFGLLELFQADPDPMWLEWAIALQRRQDELFWDEAAGGWFSTTGRDPSVLLRMKEDYDGAEPTASSVSVMNLLVLSHLVDDPEWTESHRAHAAAVRHAARADGPRRADDGRGAVDASCRPAADRHRRRRSSGQGPTTWHERWPADAICRSPISVRVDARTQARAGAAACRSSRRCSRSTDTTAAYVCRDFTCRQPVTTVDALEQELRATA